MIPYLCQDRLHVVTGGSRGIGLAIARKLSAMDAAVVITARDESMAQQIATI